MLGASGSLYALSNPTFEGIKSQRIQLERTRLPFGVRNHGVMAMAEGILLYIDAPFLLLSSGGPARE